MCAVSNVGDYWRDYTLPQKPYWPGIQPSIDGTIPGLLYPVTRAEFDQLKHDVEELKKLLLAAKEYDKAMGEPDCVMDEKVALIKKVAKLVGVDMDQVFGK